MKPYEKGYAEACRGTMFLQNRTYSKQEMDKICVEIAEKYGVSKNDSFYEIKKKVVKFYIKIPAKVEMIDTKIILTS